MGSGQLDVAWMGPWGYIIANAATNCQAVATVKYDDKPIYYGIIIARPDLQVAKFPDDTKGKSISFADVGSTSGWLVPTYYAKEVWKIDPKTYWKYSEGSTHAANEISVSSGQVDMATDFDRNRNAMIESGKVKADANKIIWTSDPLPNDAIALRRRAHRRSCGAQVREDPDRHHARAGEDAPAAALHRLRRRDPRRLRDDREGRHRGRQDQGAYVSR